MRSLALALLIVLPACSTPQPRRHAAAPPMESTGAEPTASASAKVLGDGASSYTIVKAGVFMPSGDLEDMDDGVSGELVFGRELLSFLAIEGSIGYLSTEGQFGSSQIDLWAVPLFVNARASLPILVFEPYAGVGIGGLYTDYTAGPVSSDDFVGAWNAFVGVGVGLGNLAVGAEYRYLQSGETKDDFAIEGSMATLFVSIPF